MAKKPTTKREQSSLLELPRCEGGRLKVKLIEQNRVQASVRKILQDIRNTLRDYSKDK